MKLKLIYAFCLATLVFLGCSREEPVEERNDYANKTTSESFVSEGMVRSLLDGKNLNTKASSSSFTLEAYMDSSQDTLMYIVNYGENDGWQLLSSDSRTPAILGESNTGRFSLEDGSEGFRIWIACMAQDIKAVRNSTDEELTFTADEIAAHKLFWGKNPARDQLPPELPWDGGQWYAPSVQEVEVVDSIPHLTVTQWDQHNPYNYYCPDRTDTTLKAYAGCTAIAGAQMLYHLHSKYGRPAMMYSDAICVGNINNYYREFFNPTVNVWQQMGTTNMPSPPPLYSTPESVLIAYVGRQVGMNYTNTGSGAFIVELVDDVFNLLGYDCSYGSYNETNVKNTLLDGNPVVVEAYDQLLFGDGHSFLIDGYKRTRIHTTTHHYYADSEGTIIPGYPDYLTHSYTDPEITSIKMNWGWKSQWHNPYLNDGWYMLTGGWVANSGSQSDPDMHTYQYYRNIIYNFSLTEL